uniref:Uncharacterized protein n=1 Tax=Cannabis sativa TaxID=3483 RepID=A0A803QDY7_CANSA
MECGCLGHPFDKCLIYLEKIDNGEEPNLEYRTTMKGSTLPISSYDRYRTNFSKGNTWPLLTRFAKNSLISSIPSLKNQDQPHPRQLISGESSQPSHISSSVTATITPATSEASSQHNIQFGCQSLNSELGNHQNAFAGFPTTPASIELRPMVHFTPAKLHHVTAPLTQVPINKPLQHSVAMNHSTS